MTETSVPVDSVKTQDGSTLEPTPVTGGGNPIYLAPKDSGPPLTKPQKHVNEMLDAHGKELVAKILGSESANAQAHLYRTLVEFSTPKPEARVSFSGGGVIINVSEVV